MTPSHAPAHRLIISQGLPEETDEEREKRSAGNPAQHSFCTLRGTIWKLLLGALHVDAQRYIDLMNLGPCWADRKVRNDTFRTFKVQRNRKLRTYLSATLLFPLLLMRLSECRVAQGDEEFQSRVNESQLARVLTAYIRLNYQEPPEDNYDEGLGYVQVQPAYSCCTSNSGHSHRI